MWTVDDIDRRTEILANLIVDLYKINSIDIEWFKIESLDKVEILYHQKI